MKRNKKTVVLNEAMLRRMVERILSEAFDRDEDMTEYRDMYRNDEVGEFDNNPYLSHADPSDMNSYDYCGYDYESDYNNAMDDILSTKGGQMDYDWEHRYDGIGGKRSGYSDTYRHNVMNSMRDDRMAANDRLDGAGRNHMDKWVKGKYGNDDLESGWDSVIKESIRKVVRRKK